MKTNLSSPAAVPLAQLLDTLGADLARLPPPPLAPRVRKALQRAHRPAWHRVAWGFSGALLCGVALLGSLLLVLQHGADSAPPRADRLPLPQNQAGAGPFGSGFVAVAGAERWQQLMQGEAAAAWVVPSELPRERLVALGLPFDPARAGDSVRAELLLHPSGELLAVRVIH